MNRTSAIRAAAMLLCAAASCSQATVIYVNNTSATACALPTTGCGTSTKPFKLLPEAISAAKAGDEVVIYGNTANKPYYITNDGTPQTTIGQSLMSLSKFNSTTRTNIHAASAATKPIIRGSLVYKQPSWTQVSSNANGYLYKLPWSLTQGTNVQEPEQVFRDSLAQSQRQLQQVGGTVFGGYYPGVDQSTIDKDLVAGLKAGELWPGYIPFVSLESLTSNQFYYDRTAKVLYIRLATALAAGEGIEVSATQFIANGSGMANVTLQNLVFERSNTSSYWRGGAVLMSGNGLIVDGVDFRDSDSHCLQIQGDNNIVQNSTFTRCGQVGLVANGSSAKITNNYFSGNNAFRKFNPDWEAGPTKFIGNNGLDISEISNNVITDNNGHGIWLDTHNDGNTIQNNVVAYNRIGVFLENSGLAVIRSNVIFGNKSQGIQFRGSPSTLVDGNLMVGNAADGIYVHPKANNETGYNSTKIRITNNVIAWHDEAVNKKPVWVPPSTSLYGNRYCGSPAGDGSLHFWLQDWAPDPSLGYANNVFGWAAWQSPKVSPTNPTAPAYDVTTTINNVTYNSVMQLATMPTRVQAWQGTPEATLVTNVAGIANTRSAVLAIVNQYCK
ncbi:right-handed parallel beta-helix repeat-containing protein [Aquabacterium sp.]|uniref:right-handed parallel beta-helix repeat-containing protein n=1 Tax=Aquabacterium sp. TaxID=1872578 RepID=UPI0025C333C0|nr:right-handed parallel beta-helix repeat-containing protein [Aquabacterium sp.]